MAKKQMWLGSVLASCGSAQPLLLARMAKGRVAQAKKVTHIRCCVAMRWHVCRRARLAGAVAMAVSAASA